jgi:competence protein ComEA
MNSFFKEYFTFSRRDRAGILILSVMIMAALIVPKILSALQPPSMQTDFSAFKQQIEQYSTQIDSAQQASKEQYKNEKYGAENNPNFDPTEAVAVNLQPFDPNQLTYQTARQLGLPARTAHTIENFLQKGGKFYKKEDLKKIYVLSEADYQRLEPYIQIPPKDGKTATANNTSTPNANLPLQAFDPNQLNFERAKQLGLNEKTAHAIENYLQKGGKFYKREDLKKIYTLPESDYQRLEPYIQIPPKDGKTTTANNTSTPNASLPLQAFDPNQLNFERAKQLGLNEKTAHAIENYLQKGGKFYKKEDLKKIYTLPETDYKRLEPYIQIPAKDTKPSNTQTAEIPTTYSSSGKARQPTKVSKPININTSDTTQWQQLKGIGSGYARQIVKLRSQLGGFATKEQLKEVYGMTPELYSQIEPYLQGAGTVKQININKATADEMKAHPYIKYKLADAIVKYRQQHRGYKAISDIKNIKILSEDNYTKLAPYLTLN